MDTELQAEIVKKVSALFLGLPRSLGFDGNEFRMSELVSGGIPENILAERCVTLNFHEDGFEIRVFAGAYNVENREQACAKPYFLAFVRFAELETGLGPLLELVAAHLKKAEEDMPAMVARLPQIKEDKQRLLAELRRRGWLQE
jgi:hypothetical protein